MDSKEISDKKIGIFSVGTAGHVMPSVRIIAELKEQGFDLNNLLVVTGNRDEKKYYKNLNVDIIEYDFVRTKKSRIYYFINFFGIIKSLYFLNQIVRTNNISVIFTTGSYIAPLISILGYIKKIPVYLQEQNIYAGLGNYVGSFFGKKVYTSFPDTEHLHKKKIYFVGPIIDESIEGNRLKLNNSHTLNENGIVSIGIQGGSQGSKEINDLIYETFKDWGGPLELPIKLIHITGGLEVQKIDNEFVEHIILDFVEDMASYYGSINFQITRGGGGILESALLQIINVIIPYKYGTTSKHQKKNALYLTEHHAAIMIEEPNKEKLLKALEGKIWAIQTTEKGGVSIDRLSPWTRAHALNSVKQGARELIANELYDEYKKSI